MDENQLPQPTTLDISDIQKKEITQKLVLKGIENFVRTISPYKMKVNAEVASGGKADGESFLIIGDRCICSCIEISHRLIKCNIIS